MSDEELMDEYRRYKRFCKDHKGKIVHYKENDDERLVLSSHRYPQEHEIVVEAALWKDESLNFSNYQTYIRKGLDNGRGGKSIVNDGGYAKTREEAIEWLEEEAQSFDGSPLKWEEREVVEYHPENEN